MFNILTVQQSNNLNRKSEIFQYFTSLNNKVSEGSFIYKKAQGKVGKGTARATDRRR
jgi:hypothetical protein